jgi:hypothetical protein
MNPAMMARPELSFAEWDLLFQLVENRTKILPNEIHHTRKLAYRDELESQLQLAEGLMEKLKMIRAQQQQAAE